MGLLTKRDESSQAMASRALINAENALTDLINAQTATADAIADVEAQVSDLLRRKTELLNRRRDLDFTVNTMTKALFATEKERAEAEEETHA
ncbi:hypothetical protein TW86_03840 [Halomonas sp. S2151]|uniref:hypothetical protein n=1 Tax=Halomonas sp. S2151 TaxID=579478 RepID=UPI0005F9C995|nr:hypothetical protein [Halomonas sp. S2151]KJZ17398.1 hypothetical protein TW86_03840 [Halomonas sp. S2151]